MRAITLKITVKQCYDNHEEEQMEFVTDGKLYVRGDAVYVVYDESDVSGMAGCKTTLKVSGDSLKMRRIGSAGMQTELYFEKGKRISSTYNTPYGRMGMEVLTQRVDNHLDAEACTGNIDIEYQVSLEGMAEGKNRLTIDIYRENRS